VSAIQTLGRSASPSRNRQGREKNGELNRWDVVGGMGEAARRRRRGEESRRRSLHRDTSPTEGGAGEAGSKATPAQRLGDNYRARAFSSRR
jgi:hypothetical protein